MFVISCTWASRGRVPNWPTDACPTEGTGVSAGQYRTVTGSSSWVHPDYRHVTAPVNVGGVSGRWHHFPQRAGGPSGGDETFTHSLILCECNKCMELSRTFPNTFLFQRSNSRALSVLDQSVVCILSSPTHMFVVEHQLIHLSDSSECIDLFTFVTRFKRSTCSPDFRHDPVFDQSVVSIISSSTHMFFSKYWLISFSDLFLSIGSFDLVTQLKVSTLSVYWFI